jgi:site-specific recombinase XerD
MQVSRAKLEEMQGYQSFQRMIRQRAENTIQRYARDLYRIREKLQMDPDQIVEFAKTHSELDVGDLKAKMVEGLTPSMAYVYNNDFRRLLGSNGYKDLPQERLRYIPEEDHEAYSKDDIRRMLEWINFPRGKLLVTIPAESGLRINTVLSLQYRHIREDFENGKVPIFIKFSPREREKAKGTGYPFLGEGSNRLLKECIEKRIIKKEPEAYLFAGSNKARKKENRGGPLTYASVHDILELARKKANVNPSIQPNHGLRKYFEHALIKAEIPEPIIKRFMGHSLGSGEAYVTKDPDNLRQFYLKAWPQINFESQAPESTITELTDLKSRVKQLEDERVAWTDQLIKILIAWGSGVKPDKSRVEEFARFLLEHGSVSGALEALDWHPKTEEEVRQVAKRIRLP